jgi:hypothetical protein
MLMESTENCPTESLRQDDLWVQFQGKITLGVDRTLFAWDQESLFAWCRISELEWWIQKWTREQG